MIKYQNSLEKRVEPTECNIIIDPDEEVIKGLRQIAEQPQNHASPVGTLGQTTPTKDNVVLELPEDVIEGLKALSLKGYPNQGSYQKC